MITVVHVCVGGPPGWEGGVSARGSPACGRARRRARIHANAPRPRVYSGSRYPRDAAHISSGLPSLSGDGNVTQAWAPGLSPLAPLEPGSTPRAVLARGVHALSWRVGPWDGREMSCAQPASEGAPLT